MAKKNARSPKILVAANLGTVSVALSGLIISATVAGDNGDLTAGRHAAVRRVIDGFGLENTALLDQYFGVVLSSWRAWRLAQVCGTIWSRCWGTRRRRHSQSCV